MKSTNYIIIGASAVALFLLWKKMGEDKLKTTVNPIIPKLEEETKPLPTVVDKGSIITPSPVDVVPTNNNLQLAEQARLAEVARLKSIETARLAEQARMAEIARLALLNFENPIREDPYIPTYTPPSRSGGGTYVPPYVESINTVLDPIVRQPVREDPYIPTYTNPSYSSGGGVSGTIRGINSVVRGIEKPKLMM